MIEQPDYLTEGIRAINAGSLPSETSRSLAEWLSQADRLQSALHARAADINSTVNVAEPTEDMDEFWKLAAATDAGSTTLTYWDTFENGRRRQLECVLAEVYRAPQAILVNCGMSAIAVALGSCKVKTGTRLMVGKARYFEMSGLIERYLRPIGVEILEVDIARPNALASALDSFRPEVVFLETVANMPSVDPVCDLEKWSSCPSAPIFVIDNSVQSALTRWFDLLDFPDRLIVVESGTKYLTNDAMCGVVYGARDLIDTARHFARDTGQYLQARALSYLDPAMIRLLPLRMATHSRNVRAFASQVSICGISGVRLSALDKLSDNGNSSVFGRGVGSLLYLEIDSCNAAQYKRILSTWRQKARTRGDAFVPDVRAGFGWLRSSTRVYETTRLNRSDAPCYLRISLGLEDVGAVTASAQCLCDAVEEIL
jgi:cystathionine beta-lyase/cystathionine gamma-synthase